jgi:hypothetical protein
MGGLGSWCRVSGAPQRTARKNPVRPLHVGHLFLTKWAQHAGRTHTGVPLYVALYTVLSGRTGMFGGGGVGGGGVGGGWIVEKQVAKEDARVLTPARVVSLRAKTYPNELQWSWLAQLQHLPNLESWRPLTPLTKVLNPRT